MFLDPPECSNALIERMIGLTINVGYLQLDLLLGKDCTLPLPVLTRGTLVTAQWQVTVWTQHMVIPQLQ